MWLSFISCCVNESCEWMKKQCEWKENLWNGFVNEKEWTNFLMKTSEFICYETVIMILFVMKLMIWFVMKLMNAFVNEWKLVIKLYSANKNQAWKNWIMTEI